MIMLPILAASLIHFIFERLGESVLVELRSERVEHLLKIKLTARQQSVYGSRVCFWGVGLTTCSMCCLSAAGRVADEHAVAVALQRLAKRQAARQYSAHNSASGYNWPELFTNEASDSHPSPGRPRPHAPASAARARHLSADSTFENFIGHATGPPLEEAAAWEQVTASGSTASKRVHKSGVSKDNNRITRGEKESAGLRDDYNRQMKIISQKLAEEKAKLLQLQRHPYVPRPPLGPKRPVSGRRVNR